MSLTWDDIEKIGQEMQEQKDQGQREIFSCFKGADFERGDKILIGQLFAEKFKIFSEEFLSTGSLKSTSSEILEMTFTATSHGKVVSPMIEPT